MDKAAVNFLEIFLGQELIAIAEEVDNEMQYTPVELSEDAADVALEVVSSILIEEA